MIRCPNMWLGLWIAYSADKLSHKIVADVGIAVLKFWS